jgi:hypothetical protein
MFGEWCFNIFLQPTLKINYPLSTYHNLGARNFVSNSSTRATITLQRCCFTKITIFKNIHLVTQDKPLVTKSFCLV